MDYFAAHHSSSSSSPAMSASTASDTVSLDSIPQIDEAGLDSFWLHDDVSLLWDLDFPQDFEAAFPAQPVTKHAQITSHITPCAPQTRNQTTVPNVEQKSKTHPTDKVSKRREQNRASQRLFRERKINYVRGIELQLENLNEKYQDLMVSFNNQTKEKVALLEQVAKLTAKLARTREV